MRLNGLPVVVALATLLLASPHRLPAAGAAAEPGEKELLAEAARNVEQYRKGDIGITFLNREGQPLTGAEVTVTQLRHEFLFGCIIFDLIPNGEPPYREETYKQRFKELFNFAVFPFYWGSYERQQGRPRWERLLPVLDWCEANHITAKGHPLVWSCDAGRPAWLAGYPPETVNELLKARVINTVAGFRGRISLWDVVNEPVNARVWGSDNPRQWTPEPLDKVVDYVDQAYRWARSADPEVELILNDFFVITKENTRERFYELVKTLQARGTPLTGLGIQAHEPRQEWYDPQRVRATFDRLGELGLPLHVTEFTPQSGGKPITGGYRSGTWDEQSQADFAEQLFRLSFGHPAVASINLWGFTDRDVWQTGGGLLDSEYKPKPVYERLRKLIHEEWHTALTARTDKRGALAFRGFFGAYRVNLRTADGRERSWELTARHNEQNQWVFRLD